MQTRPVWSTPTCVALIWRSGAASRTIHARNDSPANGTTRSVPAHLEQLDSRLRLPPLYFVKFALFFRNPYSEGVRDDYTTQHNIPKRCETSRMGCRAAHHTLLVSLRKEVTASFSWGAQFDKARS